MSNAVWFISYKLVEGASVSDFLQASKAANDEVLSKQKGYISWTVLAQGDTWVDLCTWETMEDAINAESENGEVHPAAAKFYAFIDYSTLNHQVYSVETKH